MTPSSSDHTHLLFICSRNRLRSPTAEIVFSKVPGIHTASAGLAPDAETLLDADLVEWADVILVMEKSHRKKLMDRFGKMLGMRQVICLDIPDNYEFMEPALVERLERKVPIERWAKSEIL
ncbi:MAG: phosphotyrosine protein phosphatase [Fibrobacteres bacterium]|nr:phosphotyrosine protein phosphatase [Fibrobacterota bacterium]